MPKYVNIKGVGVAAFPDGMSDDEIDRYIDRKMLEERQRDTSYGPVADVLMSIPRGASQMLGTGTAKAAEAVGLESFGDYMRDLVRMDEEKFLGGLGGAIPDIQNPGSEAARYGQMAGSSLGTMPLRLAGPIGRVAAGTIGAGYGAEEARNRQIEAMLAGHDVSDAQSALGQLGGALVGTSEYFNLPGGSKLLGKVLGPRGEAGIEAVRALERIPGWKGIASKAGLSALTEGVQEAGQEGAQNLIEKWYNPERQLTDNMLESAIAGGLMGGVFGGASAGLGRMIGRRRYADELGEQAYIDAGEETPLNLPQLPGQPAAASVPPPQTVPGPAPKPGEPGYITSQLGGDLLGGDIDALLNEGVDRVRELRHRGDDELLALLRRDNFQPQTPEDILRGYGADFGIEQATRVFNRLTASAPPATEDWSGYVPAPGDPHGLRDQLGLRQQWMPPEPPSLAEQIAPTPVTPPEAPPTVTPQIATPNVATATPVVAPPPAPAPTPAAAPAPLSPVPPPMALAPEPLGPVARPQPGTPEPIAISNNISDAMYTAAANMGMGRRLRGDLASDISAEGGSGPATDLAENALLHVTTPPDAHPASFWNQMKPRAFEWMKSSNWLNPKEWSLLQRAARQSGNFRAIADTTPDMPAAQAELLAIRNLMRDRAITGDRFKNGDLERAYQRTLGALQATGTALQSQGMGTMADVQTALRPSEALGPVQGPGTTDLAAKPIGPVPLSPWQKDQIAYAKERMGGYKPAQSLFLNMMRGIKTRGGGEAEGAWIPNRKVIELAFVQPAENEAPEAFQTRWQGQIAQVFDHEFTHFLRNSDVFEPKQWSALVREAKKRGQLAEAQRLYSSQPGYTAEMIEEEGVANLFRDTASNVAPSSFVKSMWQKIMNTLRRAGSGLMGRGWQSADDVMTAIRSGEVAQQQPQYEVKAQREMQQFLRDQEKAYRDQELAAGENRYREAQAQAAAERRAAQIAASQPGPIGPTEGQARARARAEERERSGRYGSTTTGSDGQEYVWDKQKGGWVPAAQTMYALKPWPNTEPPLPDKPAAHTITHQAEMSDRSPWTQDATEDPLADVLANSMESASADLPKFKRNLHVYRDYPNFRDITAEEIENDPHGAARKIVTRMADNLVWLHDNMPEEIRQRAKKWYDGANRIMRHFAKRYGVSDEQSAGVLAVMSPKNDWFMNADMGRRLMDFWQQHKKLKWKPEMDRFFEENWQTPDLEAKAAHYERIRGKKFTDIKDVQDRAVWFRLWDQTFNERDFPIVTPEGDFEGPVLNKGKNGQPGPPAKLGWGNGFNPIEKALSILSDGSRENIHAALGEKHKVRNFYNNILTPNSKRHHVTMDTHAIAAANLRALSSNHIEPAHNFGGAKGTSSIGKTGELGTYAINAEGYKEAARRINERAREAAKNANSEYQGDLLPRELQSITWEGIRGLFTAGWKGQQANVDAITGIWENVNNGVITPEEARAQIHARAGGINDPEWHQRPVAGLPDQAGTPANAGELPARAGAVERQRGRAAGRGAGDGLPGPVPAPEVPQRGRRRAAAPEDVRYSLPRNQPPPLSDRILGAASALRNGAQVNEGDFDAADLAVARKLAGDNRVDLDKMAKVNPDEHLNLGKLEMDPRFKEHLRNKVRLAAVALDRHPKKVLPFSDIRRAAARLAGGEELLDIPKLKESETLKPEVRLALGITLKELEGEIVKRTRDLESNPGMRPEARSAAQQEIDTMDHYLRQIMNVLVPARTQDGRNLVYHRIMAQGNFDRVYWHGRVKRMLGVPPNHDLPNDVTKTLDDQITKGQQATKDFEDAKAEEQAAETSGTPDQQAQAKARRKKAEDSVMDTRKDFAKHLAQYQKTTRWQGWNMLWKTGLLTNPYARVSDIGSNLSFAALERLASKPASWADTFMAKKSGERTLMEMKQLWSKAGWEGSGEGLERAKRKLREVRSGNVSPDQVLASQMDIQRQYDLGDKPWEQWLTGKTRRYVEGMQGLQSATDMPSRQMAYAAGIREQAQLKALKEHKANAIPGGLTMDERVKQLISAPTDDMKVEARAMEEFSAFANNNWFSDLLRGKQERMKGTPMGRAVAGGLDWVFPFVKVPTNVLGRVLEFSPAGLTRGAAGAIAAKYSKQALDPKLQRMYAQLIGRGSVGSALMLLGYGLAKAGLMSGTRDADDWAGRAADEAAGKPEGAIKLPGGRWAQIGRVSPGGNILVAGASLFQQDGSLPDLVPRMGGTLLKTVQDMPFMQGYDQLQAAISNPETMGQKYVQSQIGSFVPAGVARLAATVDPLQRDTKDEGLWAKALQRIPGASYALPERRDVLGRTMEQQGATFLGPVLDPFRTTKERSDPVSQAIVRDQPQIPRPQRDKKGGEDVETYRKRAELAGRLYYQGILEALQSPEYAEARTQAERAEILKEGREAGGRELSNLTTRDEVYKESTPAEKRRMLDDYLSSVQEYAVQ